MNGRFNISALLQVGLALRARGFFHITTLLHRAMRLEETQYRLYVGVRERLATMADANIKEVPETFLMVTGPIVCRIR